MGTREMGGGLEHRRRYRRDRGIVPLKSYVEGTEVLLSPQYLENILQIYNVKKG